MKDKKNEERDYGLGNIVSDCLMLGKVMYFLGNIADWVFKRKGRGMEVPDEGSQL